ncbi:recombinase family protein [Burkholderia glumae]|uniref:recombinase family protein n=1 Tax=Burkholderia glumae TaxID=337 RepID=UPI002206D244|nr:recombinase family protein [Burkholderia glumae]UVT05885.1 recombinase family protein [Burkholderia glumae]
MIIGYARVSTEEQSLALQVQALQACGCTHIYTDHGISGTARSRPGLDKALRCLRPGGKLVVWRLDRLGRSLVHLVKMLDQLGHRDVRFHSVTESIDTTSSGGLLLFHMMAALAEFERNLISERTRAGMAAARQEGKRLGRRPSLTPRQCGLACHLGEAHNWSTLEVAAHFRVHPRTLRRLIARTGPDGQPSALDWHVDCPVCGATNEDGPDTHVGRGAIGLEADGATLAGTVCAVEVPPMRPRRGAPQIEVR